MDRSSARLASNQPLSSSIPIGSPVNSNARGVKEIKRLSVAVHNRLADGRQWSYTADIGNTSIQGGMDNPSSKVDVP